MLEYDIRVHANVPFDYYRVFSRLKNPDLVTYTRIIWYGFDEEGPAIYRKDPHTGRIARIDYYQDISQCSSE